MSTRADVIDAIGDNIIWIIFVVVFFGGLSISSVVEEHNKTLRIESCNQLKMAAVKAGQPDPKCAE